MANEPSDFLRAARACLDAARYYESKQNASSEDKALFEALVRSSVCRAYYGAYHAALAWAEMRGYTEAGKVETPNGCRKLSCHESLWKWYSAEEETSFLSAEGRSMKGRRVDADYKPGHHCFKVKFGEESIKQAEGIVAAVEEDKGRFGADSIEALRRSIAWFTPCE